MFGSRVQPPARSEPPILSEDSNDCKNTGVSRGAVHTEVPFRKAISSNGREDGGVIGLRSFTSLIGTPPDVIVMDRESLASVDRDCD